jgi:hypothetical protein
MVPTLDFWFLHQSHAIFALGSLVDEEEGQQLKCAKGVVSSMVIEFSGEGTPVYKATPSRCLAHFGKDSTTALVAGTLLLHSDPLGPYSPTEDLREHIKFKVLTKVRRMALPIYKAMGLLSRCSTRHL